MSAGLVVNSALVDGAIIHPSVEMSHIVEVYEIPAAVLAATASANTFTHEFVPQRMYNDPFFIISAPGYAFYTDVTAGPTTYTWYAERIYYRIQGQLIYRGVNKPILTSAVVYIGERSGG